MCLHEKIDYGYRILEMEGRLMLVFGLPLKAATAPSPRTESLQGVALVTLHDLRVSLAVDG